MEQRVWVMAALGAIATLGVWGLQLGFDNATAIAANEVSVEHLTEDVREIKATAERISADLENLDYNLNRVCASLELGLDVKPGCR